MEIFSALLAICAGNSPVPVNSPHKGQWCGALMVVLFYLRLNKRLSKQSWGCWFETLPRPLWCHSNGWINTFQASTCFPQGRISLPQCREIIENKNISLCILKIFQHIARKPSWDIFAEIRTSRSGMIKLTTNRVCFSILFHLWEIQTRHDVKYHQRFPSTRGGAYYAKFIRSAVSKFFKIINAPVSNWIPHSYWTSVAEAEQRWHLTNMNVIRMI